jgi:hypothetical protein
MRTAPLFRRTGLAAVFLAAAVVLTDGAAPVAAAPPRTSDVPGDPIERPIPTRPPGTTKPSPTTPRQLESLTVTTDSVVATANVRYNGSPGLVTVQWGDGTTSSRNPNDPIDSPRPNPNPDPRGTIVFKHTYTAPGDGAAFARTITAQVGAESQNSAVIVTPRYRVTQYAAQFSALDRCDSDVELYTEWRVDRRVPPLPAKTWEFDRFNNAIPPEVLPDSIVSFELTAPNRKQVEYKVTEVDPIFDDLGQSYVIDLDPRLGSRRVVLDYHDFDGCQAQIQADINVRLLTPGLGGSGPGNGGGPVATA